MCDVFKTALKSEGYQNRTTSSSVISGNWFEDCFLSLYPILRTHCIYRFCLYVKSSEMKQIGFQSLIVQESVSGLLASFDSAVS